jgi:hypothetical protein
MQRLGLLPPYTVEDVKKAYRQLARAAHPDAGGDAQTFAALHADYEHALSLAGFQESRRQWLGERVEQYAERERLIRRIEEHGGRCVLQRPDAYLPDFGPDYAEILRELVAVHLAGPDVTDSVLAWLPESGVFSEVHYLDLSDSRVTDRGLQRLENCGLLGLNVQGAAITARSVPSIQAMPRLEWIHLGRTRIGLWGRWRLRRARPDVEVATARHAEPPDFDSPEYRQLKLMQRLVEQHGD